MPARPFRLIRTGDQWLRCAHEHTALDLHAGVVQLATLPLVPDEAVAAQTAKPAGLAFDSRCRLYHGIVETRDGDHPTRAAGIEVVLWAAMASEPSFDSLARSARPLVEQPQRIGAGDFTADASLPLRHPAGLAVDARDRLFVADPAARSVFVFDVARRRPLGPIRLRGEDGRVGRPEDVASWADRMYVLLDDPPGLVLLRAHRAPRRVPVPASLTLEAPSRVAVARDGTIVVLDRAATIDARLLSWRPDSDTALLTGAPFATDVERMGDGLVVARRPGEEFLRYADVARVEISGRLKAAGYDGSGIVRTPDDRVGYWSDGFRHAIPARPRYARAGRVVTYRLDSGEFQTQWGRVFLDACIPAGTALAVAAVSADEPPEGPAIAAGLPENIAHPSVYRAELSPPLLPLELDGPAERTAPYRRPNGREIPWTPFAVGDPFETYEAPVRAARGRYLWVTLSLEGNGRRTPRVRSVRVEHPGHDYLARLPRTYSRDEAAASFLQRFLTPFEGVLGELEARSLARLALVNAASAPQEIVPWLAGFVGLVLDERLSVPRRRALVAAAVPLLRARGTVRGLRQFIGIAIDSPVQIIEHFVLRGFGGPVLGYSAKDEPTRSVLGSGFRIGGAIASPDAEPLEGDVFAAIDRRAHRFTVIVPGSLSEGERGIVEHIIRLHRPAHTMGSLCTAGAGIRAGIGDHVGLTTVIGRTGRFEAAYVGDWSLGRGTVVGSAVAGLRPGASRLGSDTRVG